MYCCLAASHASISLSLHPSSFSACLHSASKACPAHAADWQPNPRLPPRPQFYNLSAELVKTVLLGMAEQDVEFPFRWVGATVLGRGRSGD